MNRLVVTRVGCSTDPPLHYAPMVGIVCLMLSVAGCGSWTLGGGSDDTVRPVPSRTRSSTTDRRRSSIRTKALSSRPRRLRRCSKPMRWPSAWTARDAGSTTCSSSVSGRSVKYEDVYLHAYETPASLRAGLTCYFQFYNGRRRHSSLGRRTPDVVHFDATSFGTAA